MPTVPQPVAEFLQSRRIAVAGVSRTNGVGNAVLNKLRASGYSVVPINPNAPEVEGMTCYPDLASIPEAPDAVVFASHPRYASYMVRQCAERGVRKVWFHRSFGEGSVSAEALRVCTTSGLASTRAARTCTRSRSRCHSTSATLRSPRR